MPCTHPLLHVDDVLDATLSSLHLIRHLSVGVRLLSAFQVATEVLKESDLLLELLGEVREGELTSDVLPVRTTALHVVEMEAVRVEANLCGVVKEDTRGLIAQAIAKAVLGGVVDPLLHPDLVVALGSRTHVHVLPGAEARC